MREGGGGFVESTSELCFVLHGRYIVTFTAPRTPIVGFRLVCRCISALSKNSHRNNIKS